MCKVRVVNDLTREETFIFVPVSAAPKKEQKQIFLLQSEHCGKLYIEVVSVTLMDYFGMIDVKTAARAGARVTIIPEMFTCDITLNILNSNSDESPDDRKGDDRTELFALREYRQGDDVRQIHWKLSSKTDVLLIKEGSLNISNSLVLYWDKRNYCTAKSMDAMAEVMASVCQRLADNGIQFDVCWNEADDIEKRSVTDSDSLLTIIPEIVKNAANPECPLPDFSGYGRMIYFSSQPIEEFNQYNSFGVICNEYIDKSDNMTVFTAANYKEELERLEI